MFSWILSVTASLLITIGSFPAKASTTISRTFSSFRPSPPLKRIKASVSSSRISFVFRRTSSRSARSNRICRSSRSRDFRTKTWQRESRGEMTSKDGFSVVAPIRTMVPVSTAPSRASCCALLKRWISSMNRIGAPRWLNRPAPRAFSNTSRTSLTPAVTAERV